MFLDELLEMTNRNYARAAEVARIWFSPPIIFQTVEEFGDQN